MDFVCFLVEEVVEEAVVEIDDEVEGEDVYCDALDNGLLENDDDDDEDDLWLDMNPNVDGKVPERFR